MKLKPNDYEILYERAAMTRLVEECDFGGLSKFFEDCT
jgi:hypothetical protein